MTPKKHNYLLPPMQSRDNPPKFDLVYRVFFLNQKGRKGAGVKGAGVANCRIFRSAVPSVVVWSILLVFLSGVKKKLWQFMTRAPLPPAPFADSWSLGPILMAIFGHLIPPLYRNA